MIAWLHIAKYIRTIGALLALMSLGSFPLFGQNQEEENLQPYQEEEKKAVLLSEEEWQEWRKKQEEATYLEDILKAEKADKKKRQNDNFLNKNSPLLRLLATILLIAIGVVVAIFVARQLMGVQLRPRNRKIDRQADLALDLETIEDQLEQVALEDYIQKAIREENYVLAIRLFYLEALKSLSQAQQIKWKKDKTNSDYIKEMKGSDFFTPFQNITQLFERAWYGNQWLDAATFRQIVPHFEEFIQQVQLQKPSAVK